MKKRKHGLFMKDLGKIDVGIVLIVIALVSIGVVMVYSSSYYNNMIKLKNAEAFLDSGIRFALLGLVCMFFFSMVNYQFYKKLSPLFVVAALGLYVYLELKGVTRNNATRWIMVFNQSFMPSEAGKVALVISLAAYTDFAGKNLRKVKPLMVYLLIMSVLALPLINQPDYSTMGLMISVAMAMLVISNANLLHLLIVGVPGAIGLWVVATFAPYRLKRITDFANSFFDRTYIFNTDLQQITYSIYAVGSGGLFGRGLGKSLYKLGRLPEPQNDFIFAIIAEEFGLFGCLVIIAMFAALLHRIFMVASKRKDTFGFILISGIGFLIAFQVIINIGVVVNLLPTTGITLPFISKGGSSLVIMMFLIGVVLNASMQNQLEEV